MSKKLGELELRLLVTSLVALKHLFCTSQTNQVGVYLCVIAVTVS